MYRILLPALACLGLALGCASGGPSPKKCKIKVVQNEKWEQHSNGFDVSYIVSGKAGTESKVWLAAKNPSGNYVSGYGVDVGPGPFQAAVELELTGVPAELWAVLETGVRRCRDRAKFPKN